MNHLPPLLLEVDLPALELIIRGLGKLPTEESAQLYADMREVHRRRMVALHTPPTPVKKRKKRAADPTQDPKP